MQSPNRRRWLLVAGMLVLIVILVVLTFWRPKSNKPASAPGQSVDPLSHETISSPPGKSPDTFGSKPNTPLYLGFDKLLDHGMTFDQLNSLKAAFYNYSQLSKPIKQISLDVDHINSQRDPDNPEIPFMLVLRVSLDGKIYQANVKYVGLSSVHLILIDPATSKSIYDSGEGI